MAYFDKTENERELSIFRTVANAGSDIVKDCIVPDTYGDVKKILATSARLSPHAENPEEEGVVMSGSVTATVLFLTEEGEVGSLSVESEYESRVAPTAQNGFVHIHSFPILENLQGRLINPRKIGIRAHVKPNLYVWEDADTLPRFADSVTDEDRMTFEEKTERIPYTAIESFSAEGVESGDDLTLDAPYLPIHKLLLENVSFSSVSAEAREGAVAVNANAELTVWYLGKGEEGSYPLCLYRHSLPISTLIECDGVKEGQTVTASLYWEEGSFAPAENEQGEERVLECDITYGVRVMTVSEKVGYCTKDMYSTRYESTLTFGECRVAQKMEKTAASLFARSSFPLKEGAVPLGASCVLKQYHVEPSDDMRAVFCGTCSASVILKQPSGICGVETVEIPFSTALSIAYDKEREYAVLPSLGAAETKAVGEEVTVSLSLSCTVLSFESARVSAVTEALLTAEYGQGQKGFTVYYPGAKETTWDIAKKYRVREEDLVFAEGDATSSSKKRRAVMILPKNEPLYHSVISDFGT